MNEAAVAPCHLPPAAALQRPDTSIPMPSPSTCDQVEIVSFFSVFCIGSHALAGL